MPGPHLDIYLMACYNDVGGYDLWVSSYYTPEAAWWVGWHCSQSLVQFYLTGEDHWTLIGYELWTKDDDPDLLAAYYAQPNPSTTPAGGDLTPQGYWHYTYAAEGPQENWHYVAGKFLEWSAEDAFLKGNGKGGRARREIGTILKGLGKGEMGEGKGKAEGKVQQGEGEGEETLDSEGEGEETLDSDDHPRLLDWWP